jgi:hypothetical protein
MSLCAEYRTPKLGSRHWRSDNRKEFREVGVEIVLKPAPPIRLSNSRIYEQL